MLTKAANIVIAVTVVLGTLAIGAVALRLYCRRMQKLPLGGDDYCALAALFLSTGASILTDYTAAVTPGLGESNYVPTPQAVLFAAKTAYAIESAVIVAMGLAKISLLLFYRRIFIMKWFLRCNTILITGVASFTLAVLLCIIFSKWPMKNQWNVEKPYDMSITGLVLAWVSLNLVFDVLTLLMPLLALRSLQMDSHRKLILIAIFSLGSACTVSSICRLVYTVKYAIKFAHKSPTQSSLFQAPWILSTFWSLVEPPVFLIAGCLLTFGPLFRKPNGPLRWVPSLGYRLIKRSSRATSPTPGNTGVIHKSTRYTVSVAHEPNEYHNHLFKTTASPEERGSASSAGSVELFKVTKTSSFA